MRNTEYGFIMARRGPSPSVIGVVLGMVILCHTAGLGAPGSEAPTPIKPAALRPGDTIALVSPAYPADAARIKQARERLELLGFKTKEMPNLFTRWGYLAGSDEQRAEAFMAAFRDPEVKAVFPGTGGYGVTRMLDRLDYNVIRANPKILLGSSDITGLHLAIWKHCGLMTFHGPNSMYGLGGASGLHPFAERYLWRAVRADSYFDAEGRKTAPGWTYELTPDTVTTDSERLVTLSPGKGRGRLIGGNLSLVAALIGTPYEIETRGMILMLEDVGEAPYRVDRMLSQLRLAGKLDGVSGVVLGRWRDCVADPGKPTFSVEEVFEQYFKDRPYPVLLQFPMGHVRPNATWPVGAMAELDADRQTLIVLEDPVTLPSRAPASSPEKPALPAASPERATLEP